MKSPADFRGIFTTDETARAVYSEAAGITQLIPSAVAVPADADDVQTLMRWAAGNQVAITARGSGSSMAGGAVGQNVILDLSRMNSIGNVDPQGKTVRVGPGAICEAINQAAAKAGLRFPVDPSSAGFCSIGGMAATNAAGAHSLRFGPTRRWIEALDCVFADGTRGTVRRGDAIPPNVPAIGRFLHDLQSRMPTARNRDSYTRPGVRKDSSGYGVGAYSETGELIDLLVGSEGTLAIFVGIELKLAALPQAVSSVLAEFDSLDSAVMASRKALAVGASACELLDQTFLEFAGRYEKGTAPQAVLLAEVEADSDPAAQSLAEVLAGAFREAGAGTVKIGISPIEQREIWELRHAASPILARLDPQLKSMQIVEDGAVPPANLAEYVTGLREAFSRQGMRAVIFGHAGDAHVHANPLVDTSSPGWKERSEALLDDAVSLVARLGGTLSGEHGDGRLRAPYLKDTWSKDAMNLFGAIKRCFDPDGLLNPGVKLTERRRGLDPVKYDPDLAPLPPEARKALDIVAAERSYDHFRLSLIGQSQ